MNKAEKGQKVFLFLVKKYGKYKIINGSTGEMFIEVDKVLRTINGEKPTLDKLTASIKSFTRAFKLKSKNYRPFVEETVFKQLISDNQINSQSDLSSWFFNKKKDYKITP